jgi:transposase-like protein
MKGYKCKRCGYQWKGTKDTDPKAYWWNEAKRETQRRGTR